MNIHTSVADAFGIIQVAKHLFRKCAFAEASPADAFDVASVRGTCAVGVTALQDTWLSHKSVSVYDHEAQQKSTTSAQIVVPCQQTYESWGIYMWPLPDKSFAQSFASHQGTSITMCSLKRGAVVHVPARRTLSFVEQGRHRKEPPVGFEPTTSRLLSGCSTN